MEEKEKRTKWIDFAKALAIIAVLFDHMNGYIGMPNWIVAGSYFDVSLFIFLMGITGYWSFCQESQPGKKVVKKCLKIFEAYFVASLVYSIAANGQFDFESFIISLIHFNAEGPLYYILLYISLIVFSPLIVAILKKNNKIYDTLGLAAVMVFSIWTTNYTNILSVYGGGGRLFGGSYLILLYLGMLFGKYYKQIKPDTIKLIIGLCISFCLTIICWSFICKNRFLIDSKFPFCLWGDGFYTPNVTLISYALLMAASAFFLGSLLEKRESLFLTKIYGVLASLGRHTLYIYLYHILFFKDIIPKALYALGLFINNIWLLRALYFFITIIGCLILEQIIIKLKKWLASAYGQSV